MLHSKTSNFFFNLRYYKKSKKQRKQRSENIDNDVALKHENCDYRHTFKKSKTLFKIYKS